MERYWLVWVGDTPLDPQVPLGYEAAMAEFRAQVELGLVEGDEEKVEIRQCSEAELEWAGVGRGTPASRPGHTINGNVTGVLVQADTIHGGVRL